MSVSNRPSNSSNANAPQLTFAQYKDETSQSGKRRDTNTRKIDSLVKDYLDFPNRPQNLRALQQQGPQHLARLQKSNPVRAEMIKSHLNHVFAGAAAAAAGEGMLESLANDGTTFPAVLPKIGSKAARGSGGSGGSQGGGGS